MKSVMRVLTLLTCLYLAYLSNLSAQPELTIFSDIGINEVSQGLFIKTATIGQYSFGRNLVETGFLVNVKGNTENVFPAYRIMVSREVKLKCKSVAVEGFLLQTNFSDILRETNWGTVFNLKSNRFDISIGTNIRIYTFRKDAIENYGIGWEATKLIEPFNLMYSFTYNIKSLKELLDVGLSVTNIDHFKISQETNPLFRLNVLYQLNASICLITQAWYETAGIFNIYANYFGFFIRTGIIWNLE